MSIIKWQLGKSTNGTSMNVWCCYLVYANLNKPNRIWTFFLCSSNFKPCDIVYKFYKPCDIVYIFNFCFVIIHFGWVCCWLWILLHHHCIAWDVPHWFSGFVLIPSSFFTIILNAHMSSCDILLRCYDNCGRSILFFSYCMPCFDGSMSLMMVLASHKLSWHHWYCSLHACMEI